MKKVKVISYKNFQIKMPLWNTLVCGTMLSYWQAPQWLWGVMGCLFSVMWIAWAIKLVNTEQVDIFEEKENKK